MNDDRKESRGAWIYDCSDFGYCFALYADILELKCIEIFFVKIWYASKFVAGSSCIRN